MVICQVQLDRAEKSYSLMAFILPMTLNVSLVLIEHYNCFSVRELCLLEKGVLCDHGEESETLTRCSTSIDCNCRCNILFWDPKLSSLQLCSAAI